MMLVQKKSPIIEAVQWFKKDDWEGVEIGDSCEFGRYLNHTVKPGDWIIPGCSYPISDEHFRKNYQIVKNRWIPGAPTTPGWYWLKYSTFPIQPYDVFRIGPGCIYFYNEGPMWAENSDVEAHCPIEEPAE